jgi:hypothetical protein
MGGVSDVREAGDIVDAGVRDGTRRNVELKAIDPDPDRSLAVCRSSMPRTAASCGSGILTSSFRVAS